MQVDSCHQTYLHLQQLISSLIRRSRCSRSYLEQVFMRPSKHSQIDAGQGTHRRQIASWFVQSMQTTLNSVGLLSTPARASVLTTTGRSGRQITCRKFPHCANSTSKRVRPKAPAATLTTASWVDSVVASRIGPHWPGTPRHFRIVTSPRHEVPRLFRRRRVHTLHRRIPQKCASVLCMLSMTKKRS